MRQLVRERNKLQKLYNKIESRFTLFCDKNKNTEDGREIVKYELFVIMSVFKRVKISDLVGTVLEVVTGVLSDVEFEMFKINNKIFEMGREL